MLLAVQPRERGPANRDSEISAYRLGCLELGTRETVGRDDETDDALMSRFCGGDEEAFEILYARFAPALGAFLRRFVGDRTLAEDLLQTTFFSCVRARGRYVSSVGLRAWLFTIAANAARDTLRRRSARREDAVLPERLNNLEAATRTVSDPEMAGAIAAALQQLPSDQRAAVLLHQLHGLSFPEVASALGTSVGAAKVRAHRGYCGLRVLLLGWRDASGAGPPSSEL